MTRRRSSAAFGAILAASLSVAASAQQPATVKPEAKAHIDAARAAGADQFAFRFCDAALPEAMRPKRVALDEIRAQGGVPGDLQTPTRVFDNLYYLGVRNVTAWALDTPDGIILLDALNNEEQAQTQIEAGLRKLGLDPARIKYIVIAHGHLDHFGGARYLQEKYKARVLMSDADWKFMVDNPRPGRPPPTRDMVITDGQKLTLGGETVTLFVTPGHTPGTVSMMFTVKDRGQPHLALLWGGTGATDPKLYDQSADRFIAAVKAAGPDVALSNHLEIDDALVKVTKLQGRGPNDPNPFISGRQGALNFMTVLSECTKARLAAAG